MTKLDVVIVSKLDHLYTLKLVIPRLRMYIQNIQNIIIVSDKKNEKYFRKIAYDIIFIDENSVLPKLTLADLQKLHIYQFPKRAGWYFQQLLKLGISNIDDITEDYLVWDADTIPLKPIMLFNEEGKYNFVKAIEYHKPYFDTYKVLLDEEPNREFSFISQFMVFNKYILKDLFHRIENRFDSSNYWYWIILENIKGNSGSLFSEYETYGHFIKNHYNEKCNFIILPWLREGTEILGTPFPLEKDLALLNNDYYYASFELKNKNLYEKIRNQLIKKIYPYIF